LATWLHAIVRSRQGGGHPAASESNIAV